MTRPLPYDIQRCAGRFDFDADDGEWCAHRDTCARYLTFTDWDQRIVDNYKGIAVGMGVRDCTIKIEVVE
jgi:hypothetical protein